MLVVWGCLIQAYTLTKADNFKIANKYIVNDLHDILLPLTNSRIFINLFIKPKSQIYFFPNRNQYW